MTQTPQEMVRTFHEVFGLRYADYPDVAHGDGHEELRCKLIAEETAETILAIGQGDIVGIARELADIIYVAYGTAVTYGIDLDKVVYEVHQSNMSKLGADGQLHRREDGKILKGPDFREPDVSRVLFEQRL